MPVADKQEIVTNDGGDAIIRVVRACVCGSDLWFYRDGSKEPNTQAGHEAIGVVEQIGDDVTVASRAIS